MQFCNIPVVIHLNVIKQVVRPLKDTISLGLCFSGEDEIHLGGYSDFDWAEDVRDRKSISDYVFRMDGAAISWFSRKQTLVATSSCEAEYNSRRAACEEVVWIMQHLLGLTPEPKLSSAIYTDNKRATALSGIEGVNRHNNHVDITYHYVGDAVVHKKMTLLYKPTNNMIADIVTKSLRRFAFYELLTLQNFKPQTAYTILNAGEVMVKTGVIFKALISFCFV